MTEKVTSGPTTEFQNESSLCEDPELVLEFLNHDFIKDSLAEYFVLPTQGNKIKYFLYYISLLYILFKRWQQETICVFIKRDKNKL